MERIIQEAFSTPVYQDLARRRATGRVHQVQQVSQGKTVKINQFCVRSTSRKKAKLKQLFFWGSGWWVEACSVASLSVLCF